MGYLIDADVHGKVFRVMDTENPDNQADQDIMDEVAANGGYVNGDNYYYDATEFVTVEAATQDVANPVDVDLSEFTGFHTSIDLPSEMFEDTQWIKEES